MNSFRTIWQRAAAGKGGHAALEALMPAVRTADELRAISDARWPISAGRWPAASIETNAAPAIRNAIPLID
ncbi:MAG: hypothetical protein IMF08_09580 [Proteobacteria bacterium]|nr:hypothetical protein [Pseudomonadota bacterium]